MCVCVCLSVCVCVIMLSDQHKLLRRWCFVAGCYKFVCGSVGKISMLEIIERYAKHTRKTEKQRYLRHLAFSVTQMLALVHCERARAATKSVTLWSELAAIALLAEEVATVLGCVRAVQPLVAEAALEALLVPLGARGEHLLGGIHRLAALGTLWLLWHFERRHDDSGCVCLFGF